MYDEDNSRDDSPLIYERSARDAQRWRDADRRLRAEGVDPEIVRERRDGLYMAVARVREERALFDFADNGQWRCILPELWNGEVVDLIAFSPNRPDRVTAWRGIAAMLGEEEVDYTAYVTGRARLWENPLQWLRSGCDGGVVLDFSRTLWLGEDCTLIANTVALACRIRQALLVPRAIPTLLVDEDMGEEEEE